MYIVKFLSTTNDIQGNVVQVDSGKVRYDGKTVTFHNISEGLLEELKKGVFTYEDGRLGKRVKPEAGLAFLKLLALNYSGDYLRATKVSKE